MTKRPRPATYLTKLVVQNAKSFKGSHELNVSDANGCPSRWTLIVGENGVGKTTLLQCIAATAPHKNVEQTSGQSNVKQKFFLEAVGVIDDSVVELLARDSTSEFMIASTYAKNSHLTGTRTGEKLKTFKVGIQFSLANKGDPFQPIIAKEDAVAEPLVLSYGAGRKMGRGNLDLDSSGELPSALFSDQCDLVDSEELIQQLDYAAVKRNTKLASRQRDTFLAMLARLLPDVASSENLSFTVHLLSASKKSVAFMCGCHMEKCRFGS